MTITYKYEVSGLKVKDENGLTNAVVQTYWNLTGTDESGHEGTFSGATPFSSNNIPNGNVFIPFNELTESQVIQWISDAVTGNPSYQQHINEQIQKQINEKICVISDHGLPWANGASLVPGTI